jgi:hypothetical protein
LKPEIKSYFPNFPFSILNFPLSVDFECCSKIFGGAYSSGSVQDLHLIPFSWGISDEMIHTKTPGKGIDLF